MGVMSESFGPPTRARRARPAPIRLLDSHPRRIAVIRTGPRRTQTPAPAAGSGHSAADMAATQQRLAQNAAFGRLLADKPAKLRSAVLHAMARTGHGADTIHARFKDGQCFLCGKDGGHQGAPCPTPDDVRGG